MRFYLYSASDTIPAGTPNSIDKAALIDGILISGFLCNVRINGVKSFYNVNKGLSRSWHAPVLKMSVIGGIKYFFYQNLQGYHITTNRADVFIIDGVLNIRVGRLLPSDCE